MPRGYLKPHYWFFFGQLLMQMVKHPAVMGKHYHSFGNMFLLPHGCKSNIHSPFSSVLISTDSRGKYELSLAAIWSIYRLINEVIFLVGLPLRAIPFTSHSLLWIVKVQILVSAALCYIAVTLCLTSGNLCKPLLFVRFISESKRSDIQKLCIFCCCRIM